MEIRIPVDSYIGRSRVKTDMPGWFLAYWKKGDPDTGLEPLKL